MRHVKRRCPYQDTVERNVFNTSAKPGRNILIDQSIRLITDARKKHKTMDFSGPSDVQSIDFAQSGRPDRGQDTIQLYVTHKDKITEHEGCLIWRQRDIIPKPDRKNIRTP